MAMVVRRARGVEGLKRPLELLHMASLPQTAGTKSDDILWELTLYLDGVGSFTVIRVGGISGSHRAIYVINNGTGGVTGHWKCTIQLP